MRQVFGWFRVVFLCCVGCVTGGGVGKGQPDERLVEAQAAVDEATRLRAAGKYSEALTRTEHALELREAVLGSTHPEVASCLTIEGDLYRRRGDMARAEPMLQRALSIQEAALGKNHPDVAQTLNSLANLYSDQGSYERAEPLYQRAIAIREAVLGKNHPDVASSLSNLAILYMNQGLYGRADPLYQRALAIREAAFGQSHPNVASSLSTLAILYMNQGSYERAEPLYQRALAIREAALGQSHPDVASSLNNLATLYVNQGSYERAEPLYQRALAIREAALGQSHPNVADSLSNLAVLYTDRGLYERAEPLYQRALAIRQAALGENHPDVASSLHNLADLYDKQGLYERAEPLYQRSGAIWEAALGKNHPLVATSLGNLANLYATRGAYSKAQELQERALAIREAVLGKDHPDVAVSLNNLASLYKIQGLYAQAVPLFERSISIAEAALGKDHPDVAESLNNLANIFVDQGLYERAEPLHQRALAIWEMARGKNHPFVAQSLNALALLKLGQHRLDEALPLFTRAFALSEQRLRHEALGFSETRLASFLQYLREDEQTLYALLRAYPEDGRVRRLALSAVLLLKGRSVEEIASISRTVYRDMVAEDRDTFERLRGLRTQLATRSLAGPGSLTPEHYQQELKTLGDTGDALEAGLARRSAPLRALTGRPPPAEVVDRVAATLSPDSALVEFIAYRDNLLVSAPGTSHAMTPGPLRYLAVVLFADASTRAVDLGLADPIDRAATRLCAALANRDASFQAMARQLYQLAFEPLRPLLGSTHRLLLSPDGQLGLVPFAALHDGRGFLLDSFDFTYLTSGSDLLPGDPEVVPSSSVVVLADPDFTAAPPVAPSTSGDTPSEPSSVSLARFFSHARGGLPGSTWVPLPGTRREARGIQRVLPQAQLFLGSEATKERLLHLPTPGILHLATHGFFLQDVSAAPAEDVRALGHPEGFGDDSLAPLPQDPLLRSGLALAGARAPVLDAATPSGSSVKASLVTALELAGLNLWGTQLVVLSACDTGRGEVHLGQGVYGLRRSLVTAGAETVVMSLWGVKDDSTHLLMDLYYRNLLAGQGRASALREAMRSLRASRPHPHDWAPFIVLGRDTPLRAITPNAPRTPEH